MTRPPVNMQGSPRSGSDDTVDAVDTDVQKSAASSRSEVQPVYMRVSVLPGDADKKHTIERSFHVQTFDRHSYFIGNVIYQLHIVTEELHPLRAIHVGHKERLQESICSNRFDISYGCFPVKPYKESSANDDVFLQQKGQRFLTEGWDTSHKNFLHRFSAFSLLCSIKKGFWMHEAWSTDHSSANERPNGNASERGSSVEPLLQQSCRARIASRVFFWCIADLHGKRINLWSR